MKYLLSYICSKWTIIIYLNIISTISRFVFGDKFHIVASGPCLNQKQFYCQNIVQNSYCSPEKNECFCQNGFVAIKEKNGLICKTLLTNLKCSMDRDCKDIYGSSCHPGPGQCSCPAETFYVAQDHVCKYYSNNKTELLCKMCRSIGGKCFDNSVTSLTASLKIHSPEIRCSCPGILYNPSVSKGQQIGQSPLDICRGLMVDLGSYCNDRDINCRAKVAECSYSSLLKIKICTCPRDHISVYQTHLKYYDCYPKIERQSKFCEHCQNSQGWCIDMNGDGNEDSCHCGKWNSSSIQDETDFLTPICRENSMVVKCSSVHLEICIKDDKFINSKRSSIEEYITATFYSPSITQIDNKCTVTGIKKNKITTCYQLSKSSKSLHFHSNCSVVSIGHDNIYYNAFLSIRKNTYIFDPVNDFLFDVSCKVDLKRESPSIGQTIDKSWNGELLFREPIYYNLEDMLSLSLIDISNKAVKSVKINEMIALDASLQKQNVKFSYFLPEECSVNHDSLNMMIYSRIKDLPQSSIDQNDFNLFSFSMSPNVKQTETYSIRSNYFPAFILKIKGKIKLSCVFRLCQHGVWCDQNFHSKQAVNPDIKIPYSHDEIKFIKSEIEFEIGDKKCCTLTSRAIENKIPCSDLLCLTPAQILTVVISVCTLAILLSFIMILLFKKQRRMKNNNRNIKSNEEQGELYELSVFKPNRSTLHRFPVDDIEDDQTKNLVVNKFTEDQFPCELNSYKYDLTLAKEYDFYVNLSALNPSYLQKCSSPNTLPNHKSRVSAEINSNSADILENCCSLLDTRSPVHIQHHVCTIDGQRSSKCSKSTAV